MNSLVCVALACASSLDSKPIAPELLAQARWVEGRVELPPGTPPDERAEIVAHATGLPAFNDFAGALGADGRFKVAFAHDARGGKLRIDANFLFLEDEPAWKPGENAGELVLRPKLGARYSGRIVRLSAMNPPRDMEIVLTGRPSESGGRIVEVNVTESDGSFDFRGLSCERHWTLTARADGFCPYQQELSGFMPGVLSTGGGALSRGGQLAGRVVDETGAPVADARLTFDCRAEPLGILPRAIENGMSTGANGAFRAAGLYPGDVLMRIELAGYVPHSIEFDALKDGEKRGDLRVVLERGLTASGKVVDPEGAAVAGARLSITQPRPGWSEYVIAAETAADGTFSCAGLSPLPMRVRAEKLDATRILRADVTFEPTVKNLVVQLAERHSLRGRVLDDLGRTVLRYTAGVKRIDPADPNPKPRTVDVKEKDGVFVIHDLEAGPWEVFVYGRGLVFEPAGRIEVPHPVDDVVFVVRRPAVVSGRVTKADGTPAARALVELEWDRPAMFGGGSMKEQTSVTTSHEGYFELTEIYPGSVRVVATTEDGRKSEISTLQLGSGEKRADISLRIAR